LAGRRERPWLAHCGERAQRGVKARCGAWTFQLM
jgi:hypothetical protein